MTTLQDHPLFVFLQSEGFTEEDIIAALRSADSLSHMIELLDLRHPALPHRLHPVIRVPRAQDDFFSAKQALELS